MPEWSGSWHHIHIPSALAWLLFIGIDSAFDDGAPNVTVYNELLIESHFSSLASACCLNIRSYFCHPWPLHLLASLTIYVW